MALFQGMEDSMITDNLYYVRNLLSLIFESRKHNYSVKNFHTANIIVTQELDTYLLWMLGYSQIMSARVFREPRVRKKNAEVFFVFFLRRLYLAGQ